jgi:hypothetical protein
MQFYDVFTPIIFFSKFQNKVPNPYPEFLKNEKLLKQDLKIP